MGGAQSILIRNQESLFFQYKERLFQDMSDHYLFKHFRVDCINDKKQFLHTYFYHDLLREDTCQISQYIKCNLDKKPKQNGLTCQKPKCKERCRCGCNNNCEISSIGAKEF